MTHLPPHPKLDTRSSEGQDAIHQMDQQPHIDTQQPQQAQAQLTPNKVESPWPVAENASPSYPHRKRCEPKLRYQVM